MGESPDALPEIPYRPGTDIYLPSTDSDEVTAVRVRVAEGALASLPWDVIAEPWWLDAHRVSKELVLRPLNCGQLIGTVRTAANGTSDSLSVRSDVIASRDAKRVAIARASISLLLGSLVAIAIALAANRSHLPFVSALAALIPGAAWGVAINGRQLVTRGAISVAAGGALAAFVSVATAMLAASIYALIRSAIVSRHTFIPASPLIYLALSPLGIWMACAIAGQAWGTLLSPGWLSSIAQRRGPSVATFGMGLFLIAVTTGTSIGGTLAWVTYPHALTSIASVATASFLVTVVLVSAEIAPIQRPIRQIVH